MLTRYCELQAYDLEGGRPARKLLSSLGLMEVAGMEEVLGR